MQCGTTKVALFEGGSRGVRRCLIVVSGSIFRECHSRGGGASSERMRRHDLSGQSLRGNLTNVDSAKDGRLLLAAGAAVETIREVGAHGHRARGAPEGRGWGGGARRPDETCGPDRGCRRGSSVFRVRSNGAGKSTLVSLLVAPSPRSGRSVASRRGGPVWFRDARVLQPLLVYLGSRV